MFCLLPCAATISMYKGKRLIIAGGIPRSGSTLLFNILRQVELEAGERLASGLGDDVLNIPDVDVMLIKTHTITRFYRENADDIYYTYRDLRTALVSAHRKFGTKLSILSLEEWVRDMHWLSTTRKRRVRYVKYEDLRNITYQIHLIDRCMRGNAFDVLAKVRIAMQPVSGSYSTTTLLHHDHFTHTGDEDWRIILPKELQEEINQQYEWWFNIYGYSLT